MTISATTQGIKPGVCLSTNKPAAPFDGQVIYMTDVDQTAVWNGTAWTVLAPIAGGRNKVINGGMSVWQRGTSFADPANMTGYTADRWAAVWGTTGRTFSQQAGFANSRYCLRIQRNSGSTGTGLSGIAHIFETANSISLQGKTVTLSFDARCGANFSATSNVIGVTTYSGTGTDQSGSTFYTPGWTGQASVINTSATLTTTSQRFTFTGTVASNATQLVIYLNFVPTGTAGANDHFEITNVQLEEGAVATPFEFEDYSQTLEKCKRYYFRHIDPVATGVSNGGPVRMLLPFHTQMRVVPTTGISGTMNYYNGAGTTTGTTINASYNTVNHAQLDMNATIGSNGQAVVMYSTGGSQYLDFSAEL